MVLHLLPGDRIRTESGVLQVLGRRVRKNEVMIQVLDGDDAVEIRLPDLLERVLWTGEIEPRSASPAWLRELRPEVREAALLKERDLLDILRPTKYDPEAGDPFGETVNRYADNVSESDRIKRKLEDVEQRRAAVHGSVVAQRRDPSRRVLGQRDVGIVWSKTNLYDKLAAYRRGGLRALVDRRYNFDSDIFSQTDAHVVGVVRDYYNRRNTARVDEAQRYIEVLSALRDEGLARPTQPTPGSPEVEKPDAEELLPRARFKRLWTAIRRGAPSAQSGKTEQSQGHRDYNPSTKHVAFEFGDKIEMDATPCDFLVRGPEGDFKPHAIFAIDVATRYVWMRLIPGPPTAWDYLLLLFDIINPFEWEPVHPDFRAHTITPSRVTVPAQRPHAVPGVVVLDHGKEGENHAFASALVALCTEVEWARTHMPVDKPRVEAFISKFARSEQGIPGYKGNNTQNSPEGRSSGRITFEAAAVIYRAWSNWYADQPHTGLKNGRFRTFVHTPHEAVRSSILANAPLRSAEDPNLIFSLLPFFELTPDEDGVEHDDTIYAPQRDFNRDVFQHSIKGGRGRKKLPFHYNPYDLSRLYFNVPGTRRWVVLYEPGADGAADRPFTDIRDELLESIAMHRRPSTAERTRARDRFNSEVIQPVVDADRTRQPDEAAPYMRPPAAGSRAANGFAQSVGLTPEDLVYFDIEALDDEDGVA